MVKKSIKAIKGTKLFWLLAAVAILVGGFFIVRYPDSVVGCFVSGGEVSKFQGRYRCMRDGCFTVTEGDKVWSVCQ